MGRSRSILVAALYLYYSKTFPSFSAALSHVKQARQISRKDYPRSELTLLAEKLISKHPDLLEKE